MADHCVLLFQLVVCECIWSIVTVHDGILLWYPLLYNSRFSRVKYLVFYKIDETIMKYRVYL